MFGIEELEVAVLEFPALDIFIGKGFDHADAREAVLHLLVDIRYFPAVIHKDGAHLLVFAQAEQDHHDGDRKQDQRHGHVDRHQQYKRSYDLQCGNKDIFRAVVRKL